MNSPEKLSSAGTTPNKQIRGADRPSDHRGWPPEQPWLKVRTGVAHTPEFTRVENLLFHSLWLAFRAERGCFPMREATEA